MEEFGSLGLAQILIKAQNHDCATTRRQCTNGIQKQAGLITSHGRRIGWFRLPPPQQHSAAKFSAAQIHQAYPQVGGRHINTIPSLPHPGECFLHQIFGYRGHIDQGDRQADGRSMLSSIERDGVAVAHFNYRDRSYVLHHSIRAPSGIKRVVIHSQS